MTEDNNTLVTADTSGQLKIWDITDVDLDDKSTAGLFIEKVFIIAHKALINTIQIVEEPNIKSDRFIITASNDNNINLHRLSNGVFIGQFGKPEDAKVSSKCWDIHNMDKYEHRKPRYVRDWYLRLKAKWKRKYQAFVMDHPDGLTDGGKQPDGKVSKGTPR